jgi:hypothetical protein
MPDWTDGFKISCTEQPLTWRLIKTEEGGSGGGGVAEEMVFTLQGIISFAELPPFLKKES